MTKQHTRGDVAGCKLISNCQLFANCLLNHCQPPASTLWHILFCGMCTSLPLVHGLQVGWQGTSNCAFIYCIRHFNHAELVPLPVLWSALQHWLLLFHQFPLMVQPFTIMSLGASPWVRLTCMPARAGMLESVTPV
jgi:hypothetical protein